VDDRLDDLVADDPEEDDAVVEQDVAGAVLPLARVVAEALTAKDAGSVATAEAQVVPGELRDPSAPPPPEEKKEAEKPAGE